MNLREYEPISAQIVASPEQPGALHTQAFYPWRRYWARMFDLALYDLLWSAVLAAVFHANLAARGLWGGLFDTFIAFLLMLLFEPLWLCWFGTTPGKALWGLRLRTADGKFLSYRESAARTKAVIGAGMGYNIPIYSLVRLWKSYRLCRENTAQPWDETVVYTLKDTKWQRGAFYIGACAAIFAVLLTIFASQRLPPHRGELTVAEFAENHNFYAKALGFDLDPDYLDENGRWAEKKQEGVTYIQRGPERPAYQYALENGTITGVSFAVELTNYDGWLYNAYETQMLLASLALAGAQGEAGLFSNVPSRIFQQITQNNLAGFHFSEAGVVFSADAAYTGYINTQSGWLLPDENAAETYFSLLFSIQKQK